MTGRGRLGAGASCSAKKVSNNVGRLRGPTQLVIAFLLLIVGVVPAIALAEDAPAPADLSLGLLQVAADSQEVDAAHLTNPEASEELPHQDLGREEAVALTEAVFEPVLQSAVGPFQNLEVEKYLGDNAAVIATSSEPDSLTTVGGGPGGDAGSEAPGREDNVLLESTIPLRTEDGDGNKTPVDLELQVSGDHLEPSAPLVDVQMPQELGDGIALPQTGIQIELPDAPEDRAPSVIDNSVAAYPNIATDTDFSVAATPTGLETFTTLRSADSPLSQTLKFNLPANAELRQEQTGAKVVQDGKDILKVLPPAAIDANGADVPVSLTVSGSSLTLTASPGADAAYPILLDPLIESYDWYDFHATTGQDTWHFQSNASNLTSRTDSQALIIDAKAGWYSTGDQSGWYYYVPRLKEDEAQGKSPTTYIARLTLMHVGFLNEWGGPYSPYLSAGILAPGHWAGKPGQPPAVWGYGGGGNIPSIPLEPGIELKLENGEPGKRDETAKTGVGLALSSVEGAAPPNGRAARLGGAAVEVIDDDKPSAANGSVLPWVNKNATAALTADGADSGLGVKRISFDLPWKGPRPVNNSCQGTAYSPCPRSWTASLGMTEYSPAEMPQGFTYVPVYAEDPVGNKDASGAKAIVRVDHTAPAVALTGSITEQATLGTSASQYTLKYVAADGDDETATPLSSIGSAGTGEGKMQRPMGVAIDGSGNTWVVDRENNRVQKFDESGKLLLQFGETGTASGKFSDPRAIAIGATGNIWVSEIGNRRVQQFTPQGEFISKFSLPATSEPYGLAQAPSGILWIADTFNHKVYKYSAAGTLLGEVKGSSQNPTGTATSLSAPTGVAANSTRVFVIDNATNQVQVFNASGQFSTQFGSLGTGPGQFNLPTGIAVARSGHVLVVDGVNGRVQVFQDTGSYLRTIGSAGSGTGQLFEPRGIAAGSDGSIAVADAGNRRIARWNHADQDPQSGVVKLDIKVDGQPKSTPFNQACAPRNCSKSGEWTYKSSEYATGSHKVDVIATDGVGLTTTKSVTILSVKDVVPPQLTPTGEIYSAPEGWVEQKSYSYNASASDPSGFGVTSMTLKIDGEVVKEVSQACPNGACESALSGTINVGSYKGGAHSAELIATDGAGNVAKEAWTINVSPAGAVSAGEAKNTLSAMEGTEPEMLAVAPPSTYVSPEERTPGNDPGIASLGGNEFTSTGTYVASTIVAGENEAMTIGAVGGDIEVTPVLTSGETSPTIMSENGAAIAGSTVKGTDTVMRPRYNGLLAFQNIREEGAPESFSWEVDLHPGQTLEAAEGDQAAVVYFEDGTAVMTITAMPARDAVGHGVPTTVSVSGDNVVTLTVEHKGGDYVYPVVAGPSFEVGYSTVEVIWPPLPEEEEDLTAGVVRVSAPIPVPSSAGDGEDEAVISKVRSKSEIRFEVPAEGSAPILHTPLYWLMSIKGSFIMNGHTAWWRKKDEPPRCPPWTNVNVSISKETCGWVGLNYQKYGHGYHITAQTLFSVTKGIGSFSKTNYRAVSAYMYGDGHVTPAQYTDCICNPFTPQSEQ